MLNYEQEKHKVFISYYHKDDQAYKDIFVRDCGHLFINKSVNDGDINTDVSTEYVKKLIQSEDYLAGASVAIVLCGINTKKRRHVDWEIYGGLSKKLSGYAGLIGILLPSFPLLSNGNYLYENLPSRLADNVKTSFASVYTWNSLNTDIVKNIIDEAFQKRTQNNLIDNSRLQMKYNIL